MGTAKKPWGVTRPETRADCVDRPRPCPWAGCRHNLILDVDPHSGTIKLNFNRAPSWSARANKDRTDEFVNALCRVDQSCVLDVVEQQNDKTLDSAGRLLNVTRERARQIQGQAMTKFRRRIKNAGVTEPT